jgi:hypothetical protein
MTKADRVVAMETIAATRAPVVRVEVMETTPTQEAETTRAPAVEAMETTPTLEAETTRAPPVEVEDMEIIPAQEVEINRAPQVEGKAHLNRKDSRPPRALLRRKDGRRPSLPLDFETEVDAVWWILMKTFIVLSSSIITE